MTAPEARSPAAEGPPRALVSRFKQALDRLWPEGGRLGLAVSGGPDSLAMLLLAEASISGQFEVATVDHGLRQESGDECALVAEICSARSIPCAVLRVEVNQGNLQAQARAARYEALGDWAGERGLSAVATAHHADDQAETLLMRLNRGSGVSGLAGVRERGVAAGILHSVPALRPLLRFRRFELAEVVERAGPLAVQDPSNDDERFERARIRKAIADSDWLDPLALSASASHLAEADGTIESFARRAWFESVTQRAGEARFRPTLHGPINLRIANWAIQSLGKEPRGQDVARLLDKLQAGEGGNLGGVLVTIEGDEWVFRAEPPRRAKA